MSVTYLYFSYIFLVVFSFAFGIMQCSVFFHHLQPLFSLHLNDEKLIVLRHVSVYFLVKFISLDDFAMPICT